MITLHHDIRINPYKDSADLTLHSNGQSISEILSTEEAYYVCEELTEIIEKLSGILDKNQKNEVLISMAESISTILKG